MNLEENKKIHDLAYSEITKNLDKQDIEDFEAQINHDVSSFIQGYKKCLELEVKNKCKE